VVIALITVWVAIAVSYQSNWPLGFFVGVIGAAFFLGGKAWALITGRARGKSENTVQLAVRSLR
jgi:zinc/manganese transport system permease protein